MNYTIINTSKGPIKVNVPGPYKLSSIIGLGDSDLLPFYDLFHISGENKLYKLIQLLSEHHLIDDLDIIKHPSFSYWVSLNTEKIKSVMEKNGIWFNGMTKYYAVKVLLRSHSVVQQRSSQIPPSSSQIPLPNNKPPATDLRTSITKGPHYESLPGRDFDIDRKRDQIRFDVLKTRFGNNPMINSFSADDLEYLYYQYDQVCFNRKLNGMLKQMGRTLEFGSNLKSNSKAGDHCRVGNIHTVRVSSYMIGNLFTNGEESIKVNGLVVKDRVSAMIIVFEHELMHLYCSLKGYTRKIKEGTGKMYYSPHGKLFQELVFRFFSHTDFRHNFNQGDAKDQLEKQDCSVGMDIYFDNKKGDRVYGKIQKVNIKRCKVVTENETIYDVPFSMLRKADRPVTVVVRSQNKPSTRLNDMKNLYSVGMTVSFIHKGKTVKGNIVKCNPKRAKVDSSIGVYNVPYEMLK